LAAGEIGQRCLAAVVDPAIRIDLPLDGIGDLLDQVIGAAGLARSRRHAWPVAIAVVFGRVAAGEGGAVADRVVERSLPVSAAAAAAPAAPTVVARRQTKIRRRIKIRRDHQQIANVVSLSRRVALDFLFRGNPHDAIFDCIAQLRSADAGQHVLENDVALLISQTEAHRRFLIDSGRLQRAPVDRDVRARHITHEIDHVGQSRIVEAHFGQDLAQLEHGLLIAARPAAALRTSLPVAQIADIRPVERINHDVRIRNLLFFCGIELPIEFAIVLLAQAALLLELGIVGPSCLTPTA